MSMGQGELAGTILLFSNKDPEAGTKSHVSDRTIHNFDAWEVLDHGRKLYLTPYLSTNDYLIRFSYMKYLYFLYKNLWTDIHTWYMKLSCFICGHLSPDFCFFYKAYGTLYISPPVNLMRNFRHEIWNSVHFIYESQGIDFLTWHMNWVYFRYENVSTGFVHEIWRFSVFQIANLTSDILPRNIESYILIYIIWALIFFIICSICCMSHMNI